jgi:hypothetical protein
MLFAQCLTAFRVALAADQGDKSEHTKAATNMIMHDPAWPHPCQQGSILFMYMYSIMPQYLNELPGLTVSAFR